MQELACFSTLLYQYIEFFMVVMWAIAPQPLSKSATEVTVVKTEDGFETEYTRTNEPYKTQ